MKILITEAYNLEADAILRILNSESDFEIYLLSGKAKEFYNKRLINLIPINILNVKETKRTVYEIKPDVLINTVDFGDIYCKEKDKMQLYNVQVVENLCSISRVLNCHLITLSNEFVFNGSKGPYTEGSRPGTENFYGNSKHAMENTCIANVGNCTVIRNSLIYGHNSYGYSCFYSKMIESLKKGNEIFFDFDYFTNPVLSDEFAYAVIKIIEKKRTGIYHVSGNDYISYSDFSKKLAKSNDFDDSNIKVCSSNKTKKYGLVNYKSRTDLGINFSGVDSGLMAMKHYIYGEKLLPI
jgi:dTDP-4-dehydrorhamnose reductase